MKNLSERLTGFLKSRLNSSDEKELKWEEFKKWAGPESDPLTRDDFVYAIRFLKGGYYTEDLVKLIEKYIVAPDRDKGKLMKSICRLGNVAPRTVRRLVRVYKLLKYPENTVHALKEAFGYISAHGEEGLRDYILERYPDMSDQFFENILEGLDRHVEDFKKESCKLARKNQRLTDLNRIERAVWRTEARRENALKAYVGEMCRLLKNLKFSRKPVRHTYDTEGGIFTIVQLTDTHFNELINISGNTYDFKVAAGRLANYASKVKMYCKAHNSVDCVLALTGDLINSDRRLDELLSNSTNRSSATLIAVDLIQQFILDLNQDLNVNVVGICGNESRLGVEVGWSRGMVTDNYDSMIFNILRKLFEGSEGVAFLDTDPLEAVVNIQGHNILFMHGHSIKGDKLERAIAQIVGKYSTKGISIRYVIFGHMHSARIGDFYARGASLCGANAYSDNGLQLSGRASQNVFFLYPDGSIDGIKVDLQNIKSDLQYKVQKNLEAYNAKSVDKLQKELHIHKLKI